VNTVTWVCLTLYQLELTKPPKNAHISQGVIMKATFLMCVCVSFTAVFMSIQLLVKPSKFTCSVFANRFVILCVYVKHGNCLHVSAMYTVCVPCGRNFLFLYAPFRKNAAGQDLYFVRKRRQGMERLSGEHLKMSQT
jgi:hypothetical protein